MTSKQFKTLITDFVFKAVVLGLNTVDLDGSTPYKGDIKLALYNEFDRLTKALQDNGLKINDNEQS